MKTWLKRIGIAALCVVVVVCAITYVRFTGWRQEVTQDLIRDSTVVETRRGPIEYAEIGHGPAILCRLRPHKRCIQSRESSTRRWVLWHSGSFILSAMAIQSSATVVYSCFPH